MNKIYSILLSITLASCSTEKGQLLISHDGLGNVCIREESDNFSSKLVQDLNLPDWDILVSETIIQYPIVEKLKWPRDTPVSFILKNNSVLLALDYLINEKEVDSICNSITMNLNSQGYKIDTNFIFNLYAMISSRNSTFSPVNKDMSNFIDGKIAQTEEAISLNYPSFTDRQELTDYKLAQKLIKNGSHIFYVGTHGLVEYELENNRIKTRVLNKWQLFRYLNTCINLQIHDIHQDT